MAILLKNATLLTMDNQRPILERQLLVVDKGLIATIGKGIRPGRFDITEQIDCSGKIVIPGLVNTHSHLTEILQKGFRDNVRMEVWREYRMLTEEMANLGPAEISAAAKLACGEMLKSGVTAVVDHFSTRAGPNMENMYAIITAFEETGIRGVLAPSLRDQDPLRLVRSRPQNMKASKKRTEEPWQGKLITILQEIKQSSGISDVMLGPSNPLNCSDSLLREIVKMADQYGVGIHTHFLETRLQRWVANRQYGRRLGERLDKLGFLSPRLSAAHCIWLQEKEIDLMASRGCSVVHNPASNLKLGSGITPVIGLKKHGINVALGTDGGDTSDTYSIFEQIRLAAFLSRLTAENPSDWLTAWDVLAMGTVNGGQAVPSWRGKIGKIKKGYRADLLIIKPSLRLYPLNEIVHQLVFCEGGHSVDTVLVDGEVVVRQGSLTRVNEEALIRDVEPISKEMYRIYNQIKRRSLQARSTIHRLYQKASRTKMPLTINPKLSP